MSTYSLTLRADVGRKLTINEMDGNFLYTKDIADVALGVANEALAAANTGGTSSVLLDPNNNLLAGIGSTFMCGSSQSYILSANSIIQDSKGSVVLGGNSKICNTGDFFEGFPVGGFVLGGCNNLITGGDSVSYYYNGNTYTYNSPNVSIYSSGGVVIGGCANANYVSNNSSIIGGCCNNNDVSNNSSIIGSQCGCVCNSNGSSVIGGFRMYVCDSNCSGLFSGQCNKICNYSDLSSVIGGCRQKIDGYSCNSAIVGGSCNSVCGYNSNYDPGFFYGSCNSAIVGGCDNRIYFDSSQSSILGGCWNRVCNYSDKSAIVGGGWNRISNTQKSTVVGGTRNHIETNSDRSALMAGCYNRIAYSSCLSSIIGGCDNAILGSCGSVILGGSGLSLCNTHNTVLVDNLIVSGNLTDEFGNPIVGGGLIQGTYSEILTLKNNSDLVAGQKYLISDKADTGIILEATTHNEFLTTALGGFLNPDYQHVGTYSSIDGFNSYRGSWYYNIEQYQLNGSYATYLRFRSSDISVLSLTGSAHTTQSTGIINSTIDNNDGTYDVFYVLLTYSNPSFRDDIILTMPDDSNYSISWIQDLSQGDISGNITSNIGITASVLSTNPSGIVLTNLNTTFEGSGYVVDEIGVYFIIDSIQYLRNGDVVINDGLHYEVIDWLAVNGYTPGDNIFVPGVSGAYLLLEKTIGNGYVEEWDPIDYDVDNDVIKLRRDKRGNVSSHIDFRWGDDNTLNNVSDFGSGNSVFGTLNPNEYQIQRNSNILGGHSNTIYNSSDSTIVGGYYNTICSYGCYNADNSTIVGGSDNSVQNSCKSGIFSGTSNHICYCSERSTIIGGSQDIISDYSCRSNIIGGFRNRIVDNSCNSNIVGGCCNRICTDSTNSMISGGCCSCMCFGSESTILGGCRNTVIYTCHSTIAGGNWNCLEASCSGGIFAGAGNRITSDTEGFSYRDAIVGGHCNHICNYSHDSTVMGGCRNVVSKSDKSSVVSGSYNRICNYSDYSAIIGGESNIMNFSDESVILGGNINRLNNTCKSAIVGGDWACMQDVCSSGIFAGAGNRITSDTMGFAFRDAIVGGHCNHICNYSCDSAIMAGNLNVISNSSNSSSVIAGCHNTITCSSNSAIIGGVGLTLDNESNKVLVPQLKIDQVSLNLDDSRILMIDACGNVNFRTFDSFTSSGGIVVGATESMTGFMNQIYASSNGSVVGGGYNCVCNNSNNSSIIGGFDNVVNNYSPSTSIIGGHSNCINNTCDSSIIGGHCNNITTSSCCSSIVGGKSNTICYGSESSTILGGCYNNIRYSSCDSVISGGYGNCIIDSSRCSSIVSGVGNRINSSCISTIIGGCCNDMCCSHCSTIIGGYDNRICGYDGNSQYGSSILGGVYNEICDSTNNSSIIGGYSNIIYACSCNSTIVGGCNNGVCAFSCNSTVIGGCNNYICCSNNSVILGGQDLEIYQRPNTVFLNGTTNFKQTVEVSVSDTISASPYSINFTEGAVKYLSTLSTDFQVNFTNIPTIANTTITYTLILNQGATPYMITGLTINAGSLETIKWANATAPEGNANQVDIIGLMFIYDGTGVLSQVLGQMGTFA